MNHSLSVCPFSFGHCFNCPMILQLLITPLGIFKLFLHRSVAVFLISEAAEMLIIWIHQWSLLPSFLFIGCSIVDHVDTLVVTAAILFVPRL